ncbi:MAG TPA: hypothetical protein VFG68_05825, partial [Fimbriiglobus sp.]|nr:hypothetical protein [Fimbriiglobus sp.]
MRKVLRVLGIVAGCAAVAVVVARLGFGLYLDSGHAKRLASEQLSALFGGTVRVTDLEAGVGSTAVQVEVMGPPVDGQTAPQPIVTGTVRANVSPIELAAGDRPTAVSLVNAQVTLRFDKDGSLLTKLPEPQGGSGGKLPAITVKGASIHLVQEGRPDFRASGIDVSVTDDGQSLKITGKAADPTWKAWTLSGEWSKSGGKGSIVLRTDERVAVNPEMLKAVPFVPAETWDWVVLTGNTTCAVHVTRRPDKSVGYRVELDPQDTHLTVPPIDLTIIETSGKVVVEDQVVTLTDVAGKTAGGTLRVDSKLDFASTPSVLTFDVKARGLNIPQLPKDWGLPPLDAGRLEGGADLKLVVKDGKVEPWGRGEADIVGGKLYGGTVEGKITLVGDGERFRFQRQLAAAPPLSFPPPLGGSTPPPDPLPEAGRGSLVLSPLPASGRGRGRGEALPPTLTLPLKGGGNGTDLAVALLSLMLQSPTSADPAVQSETTYVQANLRLKDIDLAELVRRLEVKLPIRITGRASLDIAAEIPVAQARTLRAYRIKGSLTVPTLGLEDLTLNRVTADIVFRDGVLTLTNLSGEVPRPGSPPGTFVGTARYGVDPQTDLTADLKLASIPLAEVFKALP